MKTKQHEIVNEWNNPVFAENAESESLLPCSEMPPAKQSKDRRMGEIEFFHSQHITIRVETHVFLWSHPNPNDAGHKVPYIQHRMKSFYDG